MRPGAYTYPGTSQTRCAPVHPTADRGPTDRYPGKRASKKARPPAIGGRASALQPAPGRGRGDPVSQALGIFTQAARGGQNSARPVRTGEIHGSRARATLTLGMSSSASRWRFASIRAARRNSLSASSRWICPISFRYRRTGSSDSSIARQGLRGSPAYLPQQTRPIPRPIGRDLLVWLIAHDQICLGHGDFDLIPSGKGIAILGIFFDQSRPARSFALPLRPV